MFALILALGIWFEDGGPARGVHGPAVPRPVRLRRLRGAAAGRAGGPGPVLAPVDQATTWSPGGSPSGCWPCSSAASACSTWPGAPRRPTRPRRSCRSPGGLVGAIIAAPLARLLSTWGAGALFACVLFLGTLISTRTSVAAVARGVSSMGRVAGSALTAPPRPPPPAAGPARGGRADRLRRGPAQAPRPQAGRAGSRARPRRHHRGGRGRAGRRGRRPAGRPPPGPRSATRRPPSRPRRRPPPRPTCPGPGTRSSWP